ncbi:MAG: ABC-F family ATP-binding cassette domain-containing protein [Ignavibacteria bacterium]|jgi:ATP-binding cassette subfamily F protein 3|nr:ABC-F family ATP-binding cassette domain-containing protein [Ignavibacteria bacterium]
MLTVSDLSVQFGGNYLFDSLSFALKPTDRIGLIGRNGSGKSTLLKIIAGEMSPETGNVHSPNGYKIGYLPQDLKTQSERTVFEETASALTEIRELEHRREAITLEITERTDYESDAYMQLLHELSDIDERFVLLGGHSSDADIEQVLLGLGFIRTEFDKLVSEFSGGWQMRIELAKILLAHPDCILLDEPTNHLDIESIRWLEVFLKNYSGSILIVSHDRRFLDYITNRTIEFSLGSVYDMPYSYSNFMQARKEQREQQFNAYKNQQRQIAQTERFIERFKAKATFASRAQSKQKLLDKVERIEVEDEDVSKIRFKFPEPPRSSRLIVEAKHLSKSYDGKKVVLDGIDFAIERGEKVAFVGKNGEGKTTLAKIFAKIEDYDGELNYGGSVEIAYFAQHQADMLSGDMTVLDIIDNAAVGEMRPKVRSLLGAFLFSGDSVYKKVKVLSGGEKARLALCKLLLTPSNLIILDEPTNHLDMISKDVLKNALIDFSGALVIVSHDRDFLSELTGKTIEFKDRRIKEFLGDINYYLDKNQMEQLVELEQSLRSQTPYKTTEKQVSTSQQERLDKKNLQKEASKISKRIAKVESEIEQIEKDMEEMAKLFQDSNFMSHTALAADKQKEYELLNLQLKAKMADWEELSEQLEKINV